MKILRWAALLVPNLAADLAGYVAAPFLALLVNEHGRLPRRLRWFETSDNPVFGDQAHRERWAGRSPYACVVAWLWRNPMYVFSNEILGARTSGPVWTRGNPAVSDRPLVEGWCLRRTPEGYWQLYIVRRWAFGFGLRVNLGWKLWGAPGGPNFGQYVFSVHPFKRLAPQRASPPVAWRPPKPSGATWGRASSLGRTETSPAGRWRRGRRGDSGLPGGAQRDARSRGDRP